MPSSKVGAERSTFRLASRPKPNPAVWIQLSTTKHPHVGLAANGDEKSVVDDQQRVSAYHCRIAPITLLPATGIHVTVATKSLTQRLAVQPATRWDSFSFYDRSDVNLTEMPT